MFLFLNSVNLTGRLVRDPDILQNPQKGGSFVVFTIAGNSLVNGEKKSKFFNCKAFGKSAEYISAYCEKGTLVAITGCLDSVEYTSKTGEKRNGVEIIVNNAYVMSKPQQYQQPNLDVCVEDFPF